MDHKISRSIYRKLLWSFWRTLTIYLFIMGILGYGAYYILRQKTWYGDEPGYELLSFIHYYIIETILIVILVGAIVICLIYFHKLARMIEQMTEAVDTIHNDSLAEYIKLPATLSEAEQTLNQILENSRADKRRVEEVQQQKNDMIMYMAHDLKTPLTSILGYLTLLNDEKDISDETKNRYINISLQKAYRLEDLVNDFFDITRLGYSNIIPDKEHINLSMMVEQIAYEFMPVFRKKNLTHSFESEKAVYSDIDTQKMQRVFDNLLKNCVNYSYPDTTINIKMSENEQGECVCEIINHGKTIPKEKLDMIFERFYRMDSSRGSSVGGAGLGLAITKQIVEAHGGRIWCESHDELIKFTIVLPASSQS